MAIQVTGRNIETGDSFQNYVTDKARAVLAKYMGPEISGHIRIEKVRGQFHTHCSMRLRTGLRLESNGNDGDPFASAHIALERLEKRVRRYKRRLNDHHHGNGQPAQRSTPATDSVIQVNLKEAEDQTTDSTDPLIIAESVLEVRKLSVGQAVMQLDLTEQPFLVFRNAGTAAVNIVYRRDDGNVGWINPEEPTGNWL